MLRPNFLNFLMVNFGSLNSLSVPALRIINQGDTEVTEIHGGDSEVNTKAQLQHSQLSPCSSVHSVPPW
jgi:hypothetical protein